MVQAIRFTLNGKAMHLTADPERMLVWALRNDLGHPGTKVGCGAGLCGACTVLLDDEPTLSCSTPLADVAGKSVVTMEGLAQDMGVGINPDGARQQMEGAITMGIGYALSEAIRFKDGRILDENFDTYQIPRFSWIPVIDTVLVPNPDLQAQGGGEPPIACLGAVIANAIHDGVGARVFELPMTPERVLEAIKKG